MEEAKYTLAEPPVIECGETYIVKNPIPIPMDLESLKGQTPSAALANLRWPTAYTSYRSLTAGIVNDLLKQAQAILNNEALTKEQKKNSHRKQNFKSAWTTSAFKS